MNLFFYHLEFSLENYLFEYDSDSSWINSEQNSNILLQYSIGPRIVQESRFIY